MLRKELTAHKEMVSELRKQLVEKENEFQVINITVRISICMQHCTALHNRHGIHDHSNPCLQNVELCSACIGNRQMARCTCLMMFKYLSCELID